MNYKGQFGQVTIMIGIKGDQCPSETEPGPHIYEILLDDDSRTGSTTGTFGRLPDAVWLYNKETTSLQDVYDRHDRTVYNPFIRDCRNAYTAQLGKEQQQVGSPVPYYLRAIKFCDGEAQAIKNKTDMTDEELKEYKESKVRSN